MSLGDSTEPKLLPQEPESNPEEFRAIEKTLTQTIQPSSVSLSPPEKELDPELQKKKQRFLSKLTPDKKKEMQEIFTLFDMDGSGNIGDDELRVVMKAMGVFMPPEEIERLVKENLGEMDELDLDDFMYLMAIVMEQNNYKDELIKSFKLFSSNGECITFKDLKRVAKELGQPFADEEIQMMIDEIDSNQDGSIDEGEFIKIMTMINVNN